MRWNGPTRELPVIRPYSVGRAIVPRGRRALVATIPLARKGKRTWRPDLWPARVWTPLVLLPGLAITIVAMALVHLVADLAR